MDLRREVRYRLEATAMFFWEDARRMRFLGEGISRDISVQGAFIWAATMPPPDSSIQVDLLLPSLTGVMAAMRVTGRARVVRVKRRPLDVSVYGFAVVTDGVRQWNLKTMSDESGFAAIADVCVH